MQHSKKCQEMGCETTASFNVPGETRALFCSLHAKDGMDNVKSYRKQCIQDGCTTESSYGLFADGRATTCAMHMHLLDEGEGMVISYNKKCVEKGCSSKARVGIAGQQPRWCKTHGSARDGVVVVPATSRKRDWRGTLNIGGSRAVSRAGGSDLSGEDITRMHAAALRHAVGRYGPVGTWAEDTKLRVACAFGAAVLEVQEQRRAKHRKVVDEGGRALAVPDLRTGTPVLAAGPGEGRSDKPAQVEESAGALLLRLSKLNESAQQAVLAGMCPSEAVVAERGKLEKRLAKLHSKPHPGS